MVSFAALENAHFIAIHALHLCSEKALRECLRVQVPKTEKERKEFEEEVGQFVVVLSVFYAHVSTFDQRCTLVAIVFCQTANQLHIVTAAFNLGILRDS